MSVPFDLGDLHGEVADGVVLPALEAEIRRLIDPANAERTLHWGRNYLYTLHLQTVSGPLPVVVKQFRHQGWRERWRRRAGGGKARRSWHAAQAVLAAGVSTPRPLLVIESKDSARPTWYVCRAIENALELRYFLRALNAGRAREEYPDIEVAALLGAVGVLARRLHDGRIWHRDITGGNLLALWSSAAVRAGAPELFVLDLNRARSGKRLSWNERMRDLSRFPVLRREDQERFLASYFGPGERRPFARRLYGLYHRGFLWKNRVKPRLRAGVQWLRALVIPRGAHAHIPAAPAGAGARDRIVWDALSDQPHQHAGRWQRLGVRLADLPTHLEALASAAVAGPRIWRRYRELKAGLHRRPVPFDGLGLCIRPWPQDPAALLLAIEELGVRKILLRLHPWEREHSSEEALARTLHERGYELAFALPQNRDLVRDPARWRAAVEELAARFSPYGRQFQVGQAINRSKWGVWTLREYAALAASATDILRRHPGVEVLGPAVIDFEYHQTAAALNLRHAGYDFDVVSALLYVDRRGAPENRQLGLDTIDKVLLLKAIADTARNARGRAWITEVNWPLWEGPHSPAGRGVSVDEESQANFLVRYFVEALCTGCVERVYWWQLVARGYGLIDPETALDPASDPAVLRRRPSYRALATLAATLGGATFIAAESAPVGAWLYRFRRADGGEWILGWTVRGALEVELPRPAVMRIERDGLRTAAAQRRVALRPEPAYFQLAAL